MSIARCHLRRGSVVRAAVAACIVLTLCAAPASAGSGASEGWGPPRAGEPAVELPAVSRWSPALRAGQQPVAPIMGIPIEGIGLPAGAVDFEGEVHSALPFDGAVLPYDRTQRGPALADPSALFDLRAPGRLHDFEGLLENGWIPPDPDIGVGPAHIVEVTNDDFAVYDKCGNQLFGADANAFLGIVGKLFDPHVAYDPWNGRWIMLWHFINTNPQESRLILVVSAGSTPPGLGGWWYYNFPAIKDPGTADAAYADYFDLGFGADAVYCSGNYFRFSNDSFRYAMIRTWDKAEVYNALAAFQTDDIGLTNPDGSATFAPRAAELQWTFGTDGFFVNSRPGGGNLLTVWRLADPLGAHTLTRVDINVGAYDPPPMAVQPNGQSLDTIDCRLMNAVVARDLVTNRYRLYTGLQERHNWGEASDRAIIRLYEIEPLAGTLHGNIGTGASGLYYWFPTVAADYAGNTLFVFARTGPGAGALPEVRYIDYLAGGSFGFSVQLKSGENNYGGFRWGDYFGAQLDWGDYYNGDQPEKIWLVGEYCRPSGLWGTWIGASTGGTPGVLDVTPAAVYSISGPAGGPFVPASQVYTLSNTGGVGLNWELSGLPFWLHADATRGQIPGGGAQGVTVSVDAAANLLAPGFYSAALAFSDCYTGGSGTRFRRVELTVTSTACPGDANCDGVIDFDDIDALVAALAGGAPCDFANVDVNGDGSINFFDIDPFVALLGSGASCP